MEFQKYQHILRECLDEIKENPEVLKEALQDTKDDLQRIEAAGQIVLEMVELVGGFLMGMNTRSVSAAPILRAAASRVFSRLPPLPQQTGTEG